jgi:hypothetical protein
MPPVAQTYACYDLVMAVKESGLTRKSFYSDENTLRRAKRALRVRTDAEAIRLSLERVAEMESFWRFMSKTRGALKRGSFETF